MARTLQFERIKQIPTNHKYAVFGYIKQCQLLFKSEETYYQIHKSIQYSILLFYAFIDSKILTQKESDKLLTMFEEQNKFKELEPYSYHLLYASYRDGIGEDIFKKICHDQQNLLCLIEMKSGNVWGGYTSKGWRDNLKVAAQDDDKAFMFVIRSKNNDPARRFNILKPKMALYNTSGYYLIFGAVNCYWINKDGDSAGTYNRKSRREVDYEPIPEDNYILGQKPRTIQSIEVHSIK